jgi:LuxR family maltose regulon positive regulatory protein
MAALLSLATSRGMVTGYAGSLLAAFKPGSAGEQAASAQLLIEPLSKRELEVLRLLNSDLSGPEIALELTIALTTFRFHTRNIYGKLGVNSRRSAVRRAQELDLL